MSKKVAKKIKMIIAGGQATPAPPVGSMLGAAGVAINDFCQAFNDKTKDQKGKMLPTKITVFDDKTFEFYTTQPKATTLIKEKISLKKGSAKSHIDKVAKITETQLKEIAEEKMQDTNANDVDACVKTLAGTCRSMGITVEWGV
ncbi:50S ribosomal protein L11 [Candidatus Gracilibacteria bacterium]|nr:50S ribosomal protein L11 [Candidatus Gracilibacteria bacterium]